MLMPSNALCVAGMSLITRIARGIAKALHYKDGKVLKGYLSCAVKGRWCVPERRVKGT